MGINKFRLTLLQRTQEKAVVHTDVSEAFNCAVFVADAMTGLYKVKGGAPMKPSELVADQLGMIRDVCNAAITSEPRKNFVFVYSTDVSHQVPREKAVTQAARRTGLIPYPEDSVLTKEVVWSESGTFLLEPVRFFQSRGMTRVYSLFLLDCLLEEVRDGKWGAIPRATIVLDIGCPAGPHCIDLRTRKHTQHRDLAFPSGEAEIRAVWWAARFAKDAEVAPGELPEELVIESRPSVQKRFVLCTTDQDLLACMMVQMMRRPQAYAGVTIDWLFDKKDNEYHMVDVGRLAHAVEDPIRGGGYNWMLLLTFAAACGTDYTDKKLFSNYVNELMTYNFLADAAIALREPVSLDGFTDYALAALRGFHRMAQKRSATKCPVPIETMAVEQRTAIMDSLNFICKYWSGLVPPVLAGN